MIVLLLVYILIWSVLAFYFFGPAATKTTSALQESSYFDTFDNTYVSLFVAISTANYPDLTMVSYHNNHAAALFFVLYVGLGLYFVLNLFLAMVSRRRAAVLPLLDARRSISCVHPPPHIHTQVFQGFTERDENKFRRMLLHKRHALRKAFAQMADVLPEETVEQLGSKAEYEARKEMSFEAFSQLLRRYRPTTTAKVGRSWRWAFECGRMACQGVTSCLFLSLGRAAHVRVS